MTPDAQIFVTIGPQESDPSRVICIITRGHPQENSAETEVLTLESFPKGTAKLVMQKWAARMMEERPWETRQ